MKTNRRTALKFAVVTLATMQAKTGSAQDRSLPSLKATLDYLKTPESVALLYTHFSLAFSLAISIRAALLEPSDVEEIGALRLYPRQRPESLVIFDVLRGLGENGEVERETVSEALIKEGDPIDAMRDQHFRLVTHFTSTMTEVGINPASVIIDPAIDSLTHVERVAAVTVSDNRSSSYLCRRFPFKGSWMCK